MTHEDPLVDILTRRIIELEKQLTEARKSHVTIVRSETEIPFDPKYLQNHERCIDYSKSCEQSPCYDCDLNR